MSKAAIILTLFLATSAYANEKNKNIVNKFFSEYSAGNIQQAFSHVDKNVNWWVPESLPFGGVFNTSADYLKMLSQNFVGFPKGLTLKVKSLTSEGNVVVAEVESEAVHLCGQPDKFIYNNKYNFKITLKNNLIVDVKEYNDTYHLNELYRLIQTKRCKNKLAAYYKKLKSKK